MKRLIKTSLLVIALALLAGLVCLMWFISRPDDSNLPEGELVLNMSEDPASGKSSKWPPAPLTIRGTFLGPVTRPSPEPKGDLSNLKVSPSPVSNHK